MHPDLEYTWYLHSLRVNGILDVVLSLFDELIVDDGPELLAESRVARHILNDACKLLASLEGHILLIGDF